MAVPSNAMEWLFLIAAGLFGYAQFTTRQILAAYEDRLKKLEEYRDADMRDIGQKLDSIQQTVNKIQVEMAQNYMSKKDCMSFHKSLMEAVQQ
jgi:hypothetical protein